MSKPRDSKPSTTKPALLKRQDAAASLSVFTFKKSDNPYDYANIAAHARSKQDPNYAIVRMGEHYQFHHRDEKPVMAATKVRSPRIQDRMKMFQQGQLMADSVGWKLHISVNPQDVEAAWSTIRSILMAHNMSGFKIIHPDILKRALITENMKKVAAKQFTIYQFRNPGFKAEQWESLIKEIEAALNQAGIRPTEKMPPANKGIEGSRYFTYRNDTDPKQTVYISDEDAEKYVQLSADKTLTAFNLTKTDDPFQDVRPFQQKGFEL